MAKKTVTKPEGATPPQASSEQRHTSVAVSAGGAASQHNLRNIRLIIGREYKNHVTQRSFIISTILILILVVIGAFIPTIVQVIRARTSSPTHIVVINNAGPIAGLSEAALDSYINSALNGTATGNLAPYTITSQPPASQ